MWIVTLKSQDNNIVVSVSDITAVKIDKIYPPLDSSFGFACVLIEAHYRVLVAAKSDFCYDWPFDALFKNVEEADHYSDYADASVVVDIGKKTIHFDAFSHFTKNEAEECFGVTDYSELEKVPSEISFNEWPDFSKKFEEEHDFPQFYVDDSNEFMTSAD